MNWRLKSSSQHDAADEFAVTTGVDSRAKRSIRYRTAPESAKAIALGSTKSDPSSINHARFSAMSAHLAQVAAKASTEALSDVACAHEAMPSELVMRFLEDVRRVADAIYDVAMVGLAVSEVEQEAQHGAGIPQRSALNCGDQYWKAS